MIALFLPHQKQHLYSNSQCFPYLFASCSLFLYDHVLLQLIYNFTFFFSFESSSKFIIAITFYCGINYIFRKMEILWKVFQICVLPNCVYNVCTTGSCILCLCLPVETISPFKLFFFVFVVSLCTDLCVLMIIHIYFRAWRWLWIYMHYKKTCQVLLLYL